MINEDQKTPIDRVADILVGALNRERVARATGHTWRPVGMHTIRCSACGLATSDASKDVPSGPCPRAGAT